MSREYFTRTSLYLKIFEWIKFLRGHLHQIQVCEFTGHYACKNAEINRKSTTSNGFNFRIINSLMDSWGVRFTWLDCNGALQMENAWSISLYTAHLKPHNWLSGRYQCQIVTTCLVSDIFSPSLTLSTT